MHLVFLSLTFTTAALVAGWTDDASPYSSSGSGALIPRNEYDLGSTFQLARVVRRSSSSTYPEEDVGLQLERRGTCGSKYCGGGHDGPLNPILRSTPESRKSISADHKHSQTQAQAQAQPPRAQQMHAGLVRESPFAAEAVQQKGRSSPPPTPRYPRSAYWKRDSSSRVSMTNPKYSSPEASTTKLAKRGPCLSKACVGGKDSQDSSRSPRGSPGYISRSPRGPITFRIPNHHRTVSKSELTPLNRVPSVQDVKAELFPPPGSRIPSPSPPSVLSDPSGARGS